MKETKKQLCEFCSKCQKTRNINGVTSTRSVECADGKKHIVTISYHCESCNTFVRSEEHEVDENQSISAKLAATKKNASSYRSIKTEIRVSNTEGRGLFAKESFRKGEIVSVRGGHILTRQMEENVNKPEGYWGYPIADDFVLAPLNAREVEDVMMFLNHSCEPNIGILGQIIFVAMRDIDINPAIIIANYAA